MNVTAPKWKVPYHSLTPVIPYMMKVVSFQYLPLNADSCEMLLHNERIYYWIERSRKEELKFNSLRRWCIY